MLRRLASYRREVTVLVVLGVIVAIGNGTTPFIIGKLFDAILADASVILPYLQQTVPLWAAILGGWLVLQLITVFVDWRFTMLSVRFNNTVFADYVSRGFAHLLYLPIAFHNERKHGSLGDQISRAARKVTMITDNVILQLGPEFASVLIGLTLTLFIAPLATLIILVGISIYVVLLFRVGPESARLQKRSYHAWKNAFGHAFDVITNMHAVKQSTAERREDRKLEQQFVRTAGRRAIALERLWANIGIFQSVVTVATQALVFLVAILAIRGGEMSVGDLIALNSYAMMVFGPFARLGRQWQTLQNGLVEIEQTEQILQRKPEPYRASAQPIEPLAGRIAYRDVWFRYRPRENYVLRGLSFTAEKGETVALVGPSGAGKTTTLELLSGYYTPSRGTISVDGTSTRRIDLERLRGNIAVVPQEPVLFNDTIKENIRYGAFNATDDDIERAAREAHAHEFIAEFSKGYKQLVGERGVKLSAGQKQRIAIARAILRDPSILILDEPTSALDAETERLIIESLERLMEGRTTFIIAHRFSTVRKADTILVYSGGEIVESGTHDELMQRPDGRYRYLYEYQVGLY